MTKKPTAHTPDSKTYLLKGIPPELWEQAQAKAASQRPPISMRWALILLLESWINSVEASTPVLSTKRQVTPRSIF